MSAERTRPHRLCHWPQVAGIEARCAELVEAGVAEPVGLVVGVSVAPGGLLEDSRALQAAGAASALLTLLAVSAATGAIPVGGGPAGPAGASCARGALAASSAGATAILTSSGRSELGLLMGGPASVHLQSVGTPAQAEGAQGEGRRSTDE